MYVCIRQIFWRQELQGDGEGNGFDGVVLVGVKDNRPNIGGGVCWFLWGEGLLVFLLGQGDKRTLVGGRGNEIVLLFGIFF